MKKVLVLGSGKVGKSVGELLLACGKGEYAVTLADHSEENLREAHANLARLQKLVPHRVEFSTLTLDASDRPAVRSALAGMDYVVCMLPFHLVAGIADLCNELGVHYFDVTEDVRTTDGVRAIEASGKARVALVPQCGLAPGYVAIAANDLARGFEQVHRLTLRVGALPQFPTNSLKYNITWSADGVVNEYCEPCNVLLDGKEAKVPALEGLENFGLEGVEYEAFYTSGGVGSLIETLRDQRKLARHASVAYKTIRYPGHRDLVRILLQELRLGEVDPAKTPQGRTFDRRLAVDLFEHALPRTFQDVVVVFVNAIGMVAGEPRPVQANFRRSIRSIRMFDRDWPAIELTTAAGVCAMVDLHRLGKLRQSGFVRQEECSLEQFNRTIFSLAYENPGLLEGAARAR